MHKIRLMRPRSRLVKQLPGLYPGNVNTAIARYLHLISESVPELTQKEWSLLFDACNGWWTAEESPEILLQGLVFQVEDAIALRGLAGKWKVDGETFIRKLSAMSDAKKMAIVFKVEEFWNQED